MSVRTYTVSYTAPGGPTRMVTGVVIPDLDEYVKDVKRMLRDENESFVFDYPDQEGRASVHILPVRHVSAIAVNPF